MAAHDFNEHLILTDSNPATLTTPLVPVTEASWKEDPHQEDLYVRGLAEFNEFTGKPGQVLVIPSQATGEPREVLAGIDTPDNLYAFSPAAAALSRGTYQIDESAIKLDRDQAYKAALGWALERYRFRAENGGFTSDPKDRSPTLVIPPSAADIFHEVVNEVRATYLARDLINLPPNEMNTHALADTAKSLFKKFNAAVQHITGPELEVGYKLIHNVGMGAEVKHPPHLILADWKGTGAGPDAPKIVLVGKGITFDDGGKQIKPAAGMATMKKDMGGAANIMALAWMIMALDLPVHLAVGIPIAENAASGGAYRPTDVIKARDGTMVEVGHTDAEGRLIMAEVLWELIKRMDPDWIIEESTLTGAQRVADGMDVGGVYGFDPDLGLRIMKTAAYWGDDLQFHWLREKHKKALSDTVTIPGTLNSAPGGNPGADLAGHFLFHFMRAAREEAAKLHVDVNGANPTPSPGRPKGGELMGPRAMLRVLRQELGI